MRGVGEPKSCSECQTRLIYKKRPKKKKKDNADGQSISLNIVRFVLVYWGKATFNLSYISLKEYHQSPLAIYSVATDRVDMYLLGRKSFA